MSKFVVVTIQSMNFWLGGFGRVFMFSILLK